MKAALTLMITILVGQTAFAETIATGNNFLDPIARIFTSCVECSKMEEVRKVFTKAHSYQHNKKLKATADAAVIHVTDHGTRLSDVAQNDRVALRGPHYANELKAFMFLAIDAAPYAQDEQIAATIAYLNSELGSRKLFDEVLNDEIVLKPENMCRRDFLAKHVAVAECELAKGIEEDQAAAAKRAPKKMSCPTMTQTIQNCEAKRAALNKKVK